MEAVEAGAAREAKLSAELAIERGRRQWETNLAYKNEVRRQCRPLATWQWRVPLVVGGCASGSVRFARLALHYAPTYAPTYAPAASLTHPCASGSEN